WVNKLVFGEAFLTNVNAPISVTLPTSGEIEMEVPIETDVISLNKKRDEEEKIRIELEKQKQERKEEEDKQKDSLITLSGLPKHKLHILTNLDVIRVYNIIYLKINFLF